MGTNHRPYVTSFPVGVFTNVYCNNAAMYDLFKQSQESFPGFDWVKNCTDKYGYINVDKLVGARR